MTRWVETVAVVGRAEFNPWDLHKGGKREDSTKLPSDPHKHGIACPPYILHTYNNKYIQK